jgi:uncharacterized protein YndB with AHSA1/START domain
MPEPPFDPGPLADVSRRDERGRATLVFVRTLSHPPATVWAALTDPAQLGRWAPFTADADLGTVGDTTLTMVDGDERTDLPATVVVAEPPKVLEYTWGDDLLRWELEPAGDGTRLTLHHSIDDPTWMPRVAAGWHLCLVVAEGLLDGRSIGPIRGEDAKDYGWDDLHDAYAAVFDRDPAR